MNYPTVPERIVVAVEDPRGPAAAGLIAALSSELDQIYGPAGTARFEPDDGLASGGAFVIAWLAGRAVGCGALRPLGEPGQGEIRHMYVDPAARGQRIGERILEKLEEMARAWGYLVLKLETGAYQAAAIRLYERTGYTRIPCYPPYDDSEMSVCFMKSLNDPSI